MTIEFSLDEGRGSLCTEVAACGRVVGFAEDLLEGGENAQFAGGALADLAVLERVLLSTL